MEKLPEHCPGPPDNLREHASQTPDINPGQQSHHRDRELQHLRTQVESYAGKLKAYQTLDELYAESRRECSAYKQQNDDLVRQLNSLMRRMSSSESQPVLNRDDTAAQRRDEKAQRSSWQPDQLELDITEQQPQPSEASLSSPSFVNINSSSSDDMSHHGRHDNITPTHSQAAAAAASQQNVDESILSADIDELATQLRQAHLHRETTTTAGTTAGTDAGTGSDGDAATSQQDISSNLIISSLAVMKLEKKTRLQKAMMEQMTMKLMELESQLVNKNNTITQLTEDRSQLAADVKTLKAAHNKALLDARTTHTLQDIDEHQQTGVDQQPQSGDWVQVDKRVSAAGNVDIATVSTTELELKRRADKLSSMITELVAVNRSWDDHCRQLESSHSQQVAALNAELVDIRQRLDSRQQSDAERQKEFDELMLSAKKQRHDEETAKEEAVSELMTEKRQRADAEDRCVEFSHKMAELEAQLRALQTTTAAQSGDQLMSSMSSSAAVHDRDVMLELQMLREQVNVFKEDFDQERRDREASRVTIEHLDTKLRDANTELSVSKKKLIDAHAELCVTKAENLQLQDRFQKVVDDLKTLQRQAATRPMPTTPVRPYVPNVSPTYVPQVSPVYMVQPQVIHGGRVWSCITCTYENPAQRTSCEMCGRLKDAEQSLYRRDEGRHHVAGLHDYHAVMPPTPSDWPVLPSSNLETDQSTHHE